MNIGVILAGGVGDRFDSYLPKQFIELYNKPIIVYTLEVFKKNKNINKILIVVHPQWRFLLEKILARYELNDMWITNGGKTRQESSYRGLLFLKKKKIKDNDIVVIHDAVRPFLTDKIINEGIKMAKKYGAIDVVVKTTDTIAEVDEKGFIENFPPRDKLYNGQTPQIFKFKTIFDAHKNALRKKIPNITDDCKLVLENKGKVKIVEGDYENIKITTKADIELALKIIEKRNLQNKNL